MLGAMAGHPRFFNIAGIESPGLTSAPAIASITLDMMKEAGLGSELKTGWKAERKGITHFARQSRDRQEELIRSDRRYGHVVCRCETVTEAEIAQALGRPVPCTTMDGLKRRTRLGAGRCQAGFCTPRAIGIIAEELGLPVDKVSKNGDESYLVRGLVGEEGGCRHD